MDYSFKAHLSNIKSLNGHVKRCIRLAIALVIIGSACVQNLIAAEPEATPSTGGKKYYVSEKGNDKNKGLSPETAFLRIQKAATVTKPGDTVYVMNGVYTDDAPNVLTIIRSGNKDAWITYQAFPGHSPKIKSKDWNAIKIEGASYIKIDGLELEGNADKIKLDYALSEKENKKNPATSGNGIYVCEKDDKKPHHIIISNCKVYKFCGGGIATHAADYVTIEDNIVYENAFYSPYGNSGISMYQSWNSDGNNGHKMIIRRNICHHNQELVPFFVAKKITDGNGIIIDDLRNTQNGSKLGAYKGRTLVENNIVYLNGGRGIHVFCSDNVDIVNNTSYKNSQHPDIPEGEISLIRANDVKVFNNIMYASPGKPASTCQDASGIIFGFNLIYNGKFNAPSVNNIIDKDPLFTDEAKFDFRLQPKSPAVNAGARDLKLSVDDLNIQSSKAAAVNMGALVFEKKHDNEIRK